MTPAAMATSVARPPAKRPARDTAPRSKDRRAPSRAARISSWLSTPRPSRTSPARRHASAANIPEFTIGKVTATVIASPTAIVDAAATVVVVVARANAESTTPIANENASSGQARNGSDRLRISRVVGYPSIPARATTPAPTSAAIESVVANAARTNARASARTSAPVAAATGSPMGETSIAATEASTTSSLSAYAAIAPARARRATYRRSAAMFRTTPDDWRRAGEMVFQENQAYVLAGAWTAACAAALAIVAFERSTRLSAESAPRVGDRYSPVFARPSPPAGRAPLFREKSGKARDAAAGATAAAASAPATAAPGGTTGDNAKTAAAFSAVEGVRSVDLGDGDLRTVRFVTVERGSSGRAMTWRQTRDVWRKTSSDAEFARWWSAVREWTDGVIGSHRDLFWTCTRAADANVFAFAFWPAQGKPLADEYRGEFDDRLKSCGDPSSNGAVAFASTGESGATLVVPCRRVATISDLFREKSPDTARAVLARVASECDAGPAWVYTHGGDVAWLHVRVERGETPAYLPAEIQWLERAVDIWSRSE